MTFAQTGPRYVRIGIVEDDRRARDLLVYLLESTRDLRVVGQWRSVESMLVGGPAEEMDVLLLDIQLPGMSGIEGLAPVRERFPATTILMLTVFEDEDKVFQALCNGAHGYLLKNTEPARLLDYVREAHEGGSPMSPEIARKVVRLFRKVTPPRHAKADLSPQQVRLLALLAEGRSYQSVAREMGISINTVRGYVRIVYEKLHVHSRSGAVAEALRSGVI
jgi:DNA-binding NarL/FixJ family response regulator